MPQGKSPDEEWKIFERQAMPPAASDNQRVWTRFTFYAGLASAMYLISAAIAEGPRQVEELLAVCSKQLDAERARYLVALEAAKKAGNPPN